MSLNDVFKANGMRARFEPTIITDREKMGLLDRIVEVETDLGIAPPEPPEPIPVKVTVEPEAVDDN